MALVSFMLWNLSRHIGLEVPLEPYNKAQLLDFLLELDYRASFYKNIDSLYKYTEKTR